MVWSQETIYKLGVPMLRCSVPPVDDNAHAGVDAADAAALDVEGVGMLVWLMQWVMVMRRMVTSESLGSTQHHELHQAHRRNNISDVHERIRSL